MGTTTSTAYSREHAQIYEIIHSARGREWVSEAEQTTLLIRDRFPGARTLLDIASGFVGIRE